MTYFHVHSGQCNGNSIVDTTSHGHVNYVRCRSKRTITKNCNRKHNRANPKQITLASKKQMTNSMSELLNLPLNFCSTSTVRPLWQYFISLPKSWIQANRKQDRTFSRGMNESASVKKSREKYENCNWSFWSERINNTYIGSNIHMCTHTLTQIHTYTHTHTPNRYFFAYTSIMHERYWDIYWTLQIIGITTVLYSSCRPHRYLHNTVRSITHLVYNVPRWSERTSSRRVSPNPQKGRLFFVLYIPTHTVSLLNVNTKSYNQMWNYFFYASHVNSIQCMQLPRVYHHYYVFPLRFHCYYNYYRYYYFYALYPINEINQSSSSPSPPRTLFVHSTRNNTLARSIFTPHCRACLFLVNIPSIMYVRSCDITCSRPHHVCLFQTQYAL